MTSVVGWQFSYLYTKYLMCIQKVWFPVAWEQDGRSILISHRR